MRSVIAAVLWGLLVGCASHRIAKQQARGLAAFGRSAPAGTIALNDSLYYDRTEISNFNWMEYEFWIKRTFGEGSTEHIEVLRDTSAWGEHVSFGEPYRSSYAQHPAYRDFPVVGVTHAQASAYSNWRSDRVMEFHLIKAGVIPFREDQTATDHFSVERFYATDSLKAYHHVPYPHYALPTYSEWLCAVLVSDSLAKANFRRCKKYGTPKGPSTKFRACAQVIEHSGFVINSLERGGGSTVDPIAATSCYRCHEELIWHIRGNVGELSSDSTLVLGGGWTDPLDTILLDGVFPSRAANASTGFRNVCQWKHWNGSRH